MHRGRGLRSSCTADHPARRRLRESDQGSPVIFRPGALGLELIQGKRCPGHQGWPWLWSGSLPAPVGSESAVMAPPEQHRGIRRARAAHPGRYESAPCRRNSKPARARTQRPVLQALPRLSMATTTGSAGWQLCPRWIIRRFPGPMHATVPARPRLCAEEAGMW